MTEDRAVYKTGTEEVDKENFACRPCCLHWEDKLYIQPTGQDIKDLCKLAGWSNNQTAKLLGLNYTIERGSPTLGRYRAKPDSPNFRQIPYSVWRLALIYAGIVTSESDTKLILGK